MPSIEPPPPDEMITMKALMARMHIGSRSTAYRRIRAKTLPAPIDFGNGQIRFRASEVADFIEALPTKTYDAAFKRPKPGIRKRSH
jgi:predicted DNA-binding transcriptional regulator AlpA